MRLRFRLAQAVLGRLLQMCPDLLAARDAALTRGVVLAVLDGNGVARCRACAQRRGLQMQNGEWACPAHRPTEA